MLYAVLNMYIQKKSLSPILIPSELRSHFPAAPEVSQTFLTECVRWHKSIMALSAQSSFSAYRVFLSGSM